MASSNENRGEGVIGRKMVFCPSLQAMAVDELIECCDECENYFVYCCACSQVSSCTEFEPLQPCHHFRLVFTDGACTNNGHHGATAGIGIAYGQDAGSWKAIPITESMDRAHKRTSQRAELLAALHGVRLIAEYDRLNPLDIDMKKRHEYVRRHGLRDSEKAWVVATDSEYVVKGMTEWLPAWKVSIASSSIADLLLRLSA